MHRSRHDRYDAEEAARIAHRRSARVRGRRARRIRGTVMAVVAMLLASAALAVGAVKATDRGGVASTEPTAASPVAVPREVVPSAVAPPAASPTEAGTEAAEPLVTEVAPRTAAPTVRSQPPVADVTSAKPQRLSIVIGQVGYEPSALEASAKSPIILTVGQGEGCAAGFVIPRLGLELDNSGGPVTKNLGVLAPGEYRFNCSMGMVEGVLLVR